MGAPQKLKIGPPYDPVIPLLGIYPNERKSGSRSYVCTPMFTAALCTTEDTVAAPVSVSSSADKEGVVYIYNGVSLSLRKREILSLQQHAWPSRALCSVK